MYFVRWLDSIIALTPQPAVDLLPYGPTASVFAVSHQKPQFRYIAIAWMVNDLFYIDAWLQQDGTNMLAEPQAAQASLAAARVATALR